MDEISLQISIAYNCLKYKFDQMRKKFEIENNKNKIRVLIIDLTFIYNFLFGFFIQTKNKNYIFDEKYFHIHIIEFLNLIAHYRRFFYNKLNAKNYIIIHRSLNLKQNQPIYKKIIQFLIRFSNFLPEVYVYETLDKTNKFYYNLYKLLFFEKIDKNSDFKSYILSNDNSFKGMIYSLSSEYFQRNELVIDGFYQNNKIKMEYFEDTQNEFKDLFYDSDKILSQKYREKYYSYLFLLSISSKMKKIRIKKRKIIFQQLISEEINEKDLLSDEEYCLYTEYFVKLYSNYLNNSFENLINKIIQNKKIDLYSKELIYINESILKNQINPLSIEWLMEYN